MGILAGALAMLMLFAGWQTYKYNNLKEEVIKWEAAYDTAQENYDTCEGTNKTNQKTIAELENSIEEFIAAQEEERERVQADAVAIEEQHRRELEASRRNRGKVVQILSAEACSTVQYPDDVRSLLNDAIAKASGSGNDNG